MVVEAHQQVIIKLIILQIMDILMYTLLIYILRDYARANKIIHYH